MSVDSGLKLVQAVEKFGDDFLAEEARATNDFISKKLNSETNSVVALSGSNVMDNSGLAQLFHKVAKSTFCHLKRRF